MPSADPAAPPVRPAPEAVGTPTPDADARPYHRLPGRMATLRVGNYGQRRLYLGRDHLLQVDTIFWTEHYRRFAYADIQSLLLRRTPRGSIISVVLGAFTAAFGFLVYLAGGPGDGGGLFCLIVAGVCLLLLIVNLWRGPTCTCHLQTAISAQPLLSLTRLRPSLRALDQLTARIEAAQGTLPAGSAAEMVDARLAGRRP